MKLSPPSIQSMFIAASLVLTCSLTGGLQAAPVATPTIEVPTAEAPAGAATTVDHKGKTPPRGIVLETPQLDRAEPMPESFSKVGVAEHRGDKLPLDLRFTDETGKQVRLGDYFKAGRPVVLDLGYLSCPMLCDVVMNGMSETFKQMDWLPGEHYQVITVSIDPSENYKLAASKKKNYMADLGDQADPQGWHFLTGDQDNITALAQAVGFAYTWDSRQMQFAHPAMIAVVTPDGHLSRYLYGVKFPPRTLQLSLVEASEGKIGSVLDQIILTCFHYDPSVGSYTLSAQRLMKAGGLVTVLMLLGVIGIALLREMSRRRHSTTRGSSTSM